MMKSLALASFAVATYAQGPGGFWYGIAPDDSVPGQVNLFEMTATGTVVRGVATINTRDGEYPKTDTLHCSWGTPMCYFATGVGGPYVQDAVIGVNRDTGLQVFRHELPAGIYIDNLQFDYYEDRLFSVAFTPGNGGTPGKGLLVEYEGTSGNVTILADITPALRGGFLFAGALSICPADKTIFFGVDAQSGFNDFLVELSYANGVRPVGEKELLFPITSSVRAFCSNRSLEAIFGATIQADSDERETALVGQFDLALREGLFVPVVRGDLPTYTQRGATAIFLSGLQAEFGGVVLLPAYAPFQRGEPVPYGALWTVDFTDRARPTQVLTPLNYYLAGASGTPRQ